MSLPAHVWKDNKEWCLACKKSLHEIVEGNLPCTALQMFGAVWELGR